MTPFILPAICYGPPHMAEQKQDDQFEHTYSSYVRIRDVALKTCQRQWIIGRSGKRGSRISVLVAWHDDDDLSCELNYHDQKIRQTPLHDIREYWTAVSTLLGLISSVYCNLHHWRLNQRPQITVSSIPVCRA